MNFLCSECGKVRYPVILEPMPPQELSLVKMAVAESISRVVCVLITLKITRYIKSAVLMALPFNYQRRFNQ